MKRTRSEKIIEYMRNHGNSASVVELCENFNVSDMTIRRDLQNLETNKRIVRHHGGAALVQTPPAPYNAPSFDDRLHKNQELKIMVGAAAAGYLRKLSTQPNCSSVFIASGTTMVCIATQMNFPLYNTTLVTDNVHISQILGSNPDYKVITIGGQLLLPSLNAVGHVAENMIKSYCFDYAFISAASIDENGFIYNYNVIEAGTFSAVLESSRHVIVAADSTKFNKKTFIQLFQLKKGYTLITDSGISKDFYNWLLDNEVNVIIAPAQSM